MEILLLAAVATLAFANGANDNPKGVATLIGSGLARARVALGFATLFTFAGSLAAISLGAGLAVKFNGSTLVGPDLAAQASFLGAVALGSALTVLAASRLGLPVSTTHALAGALVGAGIGAAGFGHVHLSALGRGVLLPLLLSPLLAMLLSILAHPLAARLSRVPDCVCLEAPPPRPSGEGTAALAVTAPPAAVRIDHVTGCETASVLARTRVSHAAHWLSAATLSFARALNDTPKIAAVLLAGSAFAARPSAGLVAAAMAAGGLLGSAHVARTLGERITPMDPGPALGTNVIAASLVLLASMFALPVSTTHVASGGIFGIGLLRRREADWRRVRDILLAWLATLPLGAALGYAAYRLLSRI